MPVAPAQAQTRYKYSQLHCSATSLPVGACKTHEAFLCNFTSTPFLRTLTTTEVTEVMLDQRVYCSENLPTYLSDSSTPPAPNGRSVSTNSYNNNNDILVLSCS